jgi:hypothetical protein
VERTLIKFVRSRRKNGRKDAYRGVSESAHLIFYSLSEKQEQEHASAFLTPDTGVLRQIPSSRECLPPRSVLYRIGRSYTTKNARFFILASLHVLITDNDILAQHF